MANTIYYFETKHTKNNSLCSALNNLYGNYLAPDDKGAVKQLFEGRYTLFLVLSYMQIGTWLISVKGQPKNIWLSKSATNG